MSNKKENKNFKMIGDKKRGMGFPGIVLMLVIISLVLFFVVNIATGMGKKEMSFQEIKKIQESHEGYKDGIEVPRIELPKPEVKKEIAREPVYTEDNDSLLISTQ